MSVAVFLNSSFRFIEVNGATDVQAGIDTFADEVLNHNTPAWTDMGGNLFKSPVDGSGRFFDVLLTRINQNTLEMRLRDQNAVTLCTRRAIPTAGVAWMLRVFSGQYHFHIEFYSYGANPYWLCGGILDLSPDAQNAHPHYCWGTGRHSAAGTDDNYGNAHFAGMLDNNVVQLVARATQYGCYNQAHALLTQTGSRIYRPLEYWNWRAGVSNQYYLAGRVYQTLLVELNAPMGARFTVPIDNATTGIFMVLGRWGYNYGKLAMRIS